MIFKKEVKQMMDRETIIRGLEIERECVSRDCDRDCGKCDLVQDREWLLSVYDVALELLKEQEKVEPIISYGTFRCGNCGNIVGYNDGYGRGYQNNFCSNCGQAVKWNA